MAFLANIMVAKRGEFVFRAYNDPEVVAFTLRSWFCPLPSFRLSQSAFTKCHFLPSLLRFLDVIFCCVFLPGSEAIVYFERALQFLQQQSLPEMPDEADVRELYLQLGRVYELASQTEKASALDAERDKLIFKRKDNRSGE